MGSGNIHDMSECRDGRLGIGEGGGAAAAVCAALLLGAAAAACRTVSDGAAASPTPPASTAEPLTNSLPAGESGNAEGRVISLRVNEAGEVFWDGEAVDPQTLDKRMAALRKEDAVAWCGGTPDQTLNASQQSVFESILKLGARIVWVQEDQAANTGAGGSRPVTVNTKHIREALSLYDRLKGASEPDRRLFPMDVVVRFEPDAQRGYVLRRVELGLIGESIWVVHESLSDAENATSIQFKREW
jgi:hypothetical protein